MFNNIEGGVVAVLAVWKNNILECITDPFIIEKETGILNFFTHEK